MCLPEEPPGISGPEGGGLPASFDLRHFGASRPRRRRRARVRPNHRPQATTPLGPDRPWLRPAHWPQPHLRSCRRRPPTTGALSAGRQPWAHPHGTGACGVHPPTPAATGTRAPQGSADEPLARANGPRQQIEDSSLPPIATLPVGCDSPPAADDSPDSSPLSRRCATLWGWKQSRSSTRPSRRCWPNSAHPRSSVRVSTPCCDTSSNGPWRTVSNRCCQCSIFARAKSRAIRCSSPNTPSVRCWGVNASSSSSRPNPSNGRSRSLAARSRTRRSNCRCTGVENSTQ